MKISKGIIALIALAAITTVAAKAENGIVSPYSRYGYGVLNNQANTVQRSMGGVGYAMRSGRQINFMNPASYAASDSLTFLFDMAGNIQSLHTSENAETGTNFTGALDYISLQVPITKWLGAAAGLVPFSQVGYSFSDDITYGTNAHTGSGGINQLFVGFGVKPFKGLTLGANISYLFGTITNDTYVYTDGTNTTSATTLFERVIEVRDYNLRFGVQYGLHLNADNAVTIGAVYSPKKSFRGSAYGMKYDVTSDSSTDTIANFGLNGNAEMAETWGAGISYDWQNRLSAEVDVTYQPWKNVKYANIEGFDNGTNFNNRWKVAGGVQFVAKPRGSWFQRINYRIGASYCNDYIKVGDNSVREKALTLGLGLPAPSAKTMINLSFEYKNRQANPTPLIKENYYTVTLGINFNELWFWRNKIR
jgi:uncharacterized protein YfiM (DUF2279 family)